MADDSNAKRGPERTSRPMPEPIPATPAELARVLVSMPPQKDRKAREQTAQGRELQRSVQWSATASEGSGSSVDHVAAGDHPAAVLGFPWARPCVISEDICEQVSPPLHRIFVDALFRVSKPSLALSNPSPVKLSRRGTRHPRVAIDAQCATR